jgi:zinc protease
MGTPLSMTPRRLPCSTLVLATALASVGMLACKDRSDRSGFTEPSPWKGPIPTGKYDQLTTAEAVLETSIAAQGGRVRIAKLKAVRTTGTVTYPTEKKLPESTIEVLEAPRNKITTVIIPGLVKFVEGVTGDVAWEVSSTEGARLITGAERTESLRDATFNTDLAWKELYPKVALAGVFDFTGAPAYKVVLTPADGEPETRYIATDTLLPLGVHAISTTSEGKHPTDSRFFDWREVDGIKYSYRLVIKGGTEVIINKIELDPTLDPAAFALPPEIEALQNKI